MESDSGFNHFAGILYEEYCRSVGGNAFNGDPLPDWKTFCSDPQKKLQVDAWKKVAVKAADWLGQELVKTIIAQSDPEQAG